MRYNSDYSKHFILHLGLNQFWQLKEEELEKEVYLVDGIFNLSMRKG
jgi:hypothetical protein